MIIFLDLLTRDELFTDSYKITESPSGIFLYVEGKTVTRKEGFDENLISANASAEQSVEDFDVPTISGVDIVLNHNLVEVPLTRKAFVAYLKKYLKAIRAKLEEDDPSKAKAFKENAEKEVPELLKNFDNFQFYTGETMDPDGAHGLLDYRKSDDVPIMTFFKDGLIQEKS